MVSIPPLGKKTFLGRKRQGQGRKGQHWAGASPGGVVQAPKEGAVEAATRFYPRSHVPMWTIST